jgi:hypothetical protein
MLRRGALSLQGIISILKLINRVVLSFLFSQNSCNIQTKAALCKKRKEINFFLLLDQLN